MTPAATLTAYAEGKTGTAALMLLAAAADLAAREVERDADEAVTSL